MPPKRKREMEDIVQSRIIKFVIGKTEAECFVHEAIIVSLSEPLRALVTNGMKESVEAKVVWGKVEMSDFANLVEYAYTHDFEIIDHDKEPGDGKYCSLNEHMEDHESSAHPAADFAVEHFHYANKNLIHHSRDHYLSHAKLYLLADQYAISGLMDLCVEKIRQMLVNNPADEDLFGTVWGLLRFLWQRTMPKNKLTLLLLRYLLTNLSMATSSLHAAEVSNDTTEILAALMLMAPASYWDLLSEYWFEKSWPPI